MEKLTNKQQFVVDYLKEKCTLPINSGWVSPTEVGRIYGIKFLNSFTKHSSTGSPILKKLVKLGYVERNNKGWYKYKMK